MLLAIGIAIIQQVTFLSYLTESGFFTKPASQETHALMVGVALFSALLNIPTSIWNIIMIKEANKKRDIVGAVISIASFVFAVGYLIFDFTTRIHSQGGKIF